MPFEVQCLLYHVLCGVAGISLAEKRGALRREALQRRTTETGQDPI